jgi:hypothetical protein
MKKIKFEKSAPQISANELNEFERQLQVSLPEDYKTFVLNNNGGRPDKSCFTTGNDVSSSDLDWLFSFEVGESHISIFRNIFLFKDRIPNDLLPIGRDPFGNLICIGLEDKLGKIYFWDHEEEADDDEKSTYTNVYKISDSFVDFINMLYKYDLDCDDRNNSIWLSNHDKYSLPYSTEVKKYGAIVTDFFAKASVDVDSYIIEEEKEEIVTAAILRYDERSKGIRFCRRINADGSFEDYQEQLA